MATATSYEIGRKLNLNEPSFIQLNIWYFKFSSLDVILFTSNLILFNYSCPLLKAWQLHEEGRPLELVDPEMGEFPEEEVIRYIKVAFFCTQSAANRRPLTSQVVDMLSKQIRLNDKLLTAPGFFRDSDSASRGPSSMKKSSTDSTSYQMSSVPVTITEVTPR